MARQRYKSGPKKGKFMSNRAIAAQKRARKTKSTALVKRGKTGMAKSKKKKSRRGSSRRGNPSGISMGEVKDLMMGGAIYGFITEEEASAEGEGEIRATIVSTLAKMPSIGNRDISNGIALYLIDKHIWGNKYLRMTAKAALVSGAVRFGRRGFKLGGQHDASELSGGWDEAVDVTDQGEQVSGVME